MRSRLLVWALPVLYAARLGVRVGVATTRGQGRDMSTQEWRSTCICPDPWCPVHAKCHCGATMIIDDPDSLAFCPDCLMDRLPVGACGTRLS